MQTRMRKVFALAAAATVFVSLYLNVLRPWHRSWGASAAEQQPSWRATTS